jgi:hypothetical protein
MLIDKLNKDKQYICLEIGNGLIAKSLQEIQHKVYHDIPVEKIASHAFAIANNNIYECHAKWHGVRKYSIDEYNRDNKNPILIYEYPLNINRLGYYVKYNPGYSFTQLADDVGDRLMGLKIPAAVGMVCSEYVAACLEDFDICYKLKIPYQLITPVDLQEYLKDKEVING